MKIQSMVVPFSQWEKTLGLCANNSVQIFQMQGALSPHRTEEHLRKFVLNEQVVAPLEGTVELDFLVSLPEELSMARSRIKSFTRHLSSLDHRAEKILSASEELILNAVVSAPNAAGKTASPIKEAKLLFELSNSSLWIHCIDNHGSFSKDRFAFSHRESLENYSDHGHSGRGLKIILNSCTDLYIKSIPGKLTWVAARVDLLLTGRQADSEPKIVYLDLL